MNQDKKLIKTTYKNVKIEEKWCAARTYTYFETNLSAHDDPNYPCNLLGMDSLEETKKQIDERLKEMGLTKKKLR